MLDHKNKNHVKDVIGINIIITIPLNSLLLKSDIKYIYYIIYIYILYFSSIINY